MAPPRRRRKVPVNVTRRAPTPPPPAAMRSRRPEIDAFLGRTHTVDQLTFIQRRLLDELGFGHELELTWRRWPRISAAAQAELLKQELYDRRRATEEGEEPPMQSAWVRHFLGVGLIEGLAAITAGPPEWDEWVASHPKEFRRGSIAVSRMIDKARVIRLGGDRHPLGDRKHEREKYARLLKELGGELDGWGRTRTNGHFIDGTRGHQAAQVRQWNKRRRDRLERARGRQGNAFAHPFELRGTDETRTAGSDNPHRDCDPADGE